MPIRTIPTIEIANLEKNPKEVNQRAITQTIPPRTAIAEPEIVFVLLTCVIKFNYLAYFYIFLMQNPKIYICI